MNVKEINEVLKYFVEYHISDEDKKYFHKENDNFKINISLNNEVYQLNTDHEIWGIELENIDKLKIRFESFTGEKLEEVSEDNFYNQ